MNVINDIELNKEYSTAAFLKILKIDSATFSKNKARFLNLFEGFFTYEHYQKKAGSNRWYFKVTSFLTDEIPEKMGSKKHQIEEVMKYVDETVDKYIEKEGAYVNGTEIGDYIYYQDGNPYEYAQRTCQGQARSSLKNHYDINKAHRKWRAIVYDDEGVPSRIDLEPEEVDLFYRLWKSPENLEEEALELEMFQEGEISLNEMKQEQLGRYIAAKMEFKHYTGGKYPMLMPLREKKCAWE